MPDPNHTDNEAADDGPALPRPEVSALEGQRVRASMARRLLGEQDPGPTLGRFEQLEPLGKGAMGVVYSAYDPKLDRRVALKVLSSRASGRAEAGLSEARALARVNHPNIVTIHEVGTQDGAAFIAMELVEGEALQRWTQAEPRAWGEVLEAILQAAAGLHAAHQAGITHRDVKPANIMKGNDGRVRVTDFGLAEIATGRPAAPSTVSGTPGYVAPELWAGAVATSASDQYALGVTMWQLLTGTPPEPGRGVPYSSITSARCPRWMARVIARALDPVPQERWPSLEAFSQALLRARRRRWWTRAAVLGVAGAGVVGLVTSVQARHRQATTRACVDEARSGLPWTTARAERVRRGLSSTEVAGTDDMVERLLPRLDAYVQRWQEMSTQACVLERVEGRWSVDLHERAQWCLADRADTFSIEVERLEAPAPRDVVGAPQIVSALPSVALCLDEAWLEQQHLPEPGPRSTIRRLRAEVVRLDARVPEIPAAQALEELDQLMPSVRALQWTPLELLVEYTRARLLWRDGQRAASEAASRDLYFRAARFGAWERAARAGLDLSLRLQENPKRLSDAELWNRHAGVAVEHAGLSKTSVEAVRRGALGYIAWQRGEPERARAEVREALALYRTDPAPGGLGMAESLELLAMLDQNSGQLAAAQEAMQHVIVLREAVFGEQHEVVALSVNNLASIVEARGEYPEAKRLYQRARVLLERSRSRNPGGLARILGNLADCEMREGRAAAAVALLNEALPLSEQAFDATHPEVADVLSSLARAQLADGHLDEALVSARRALDIRVGAEESQADAQVLLASVYAAAGRRSEAVAAADEALRRVAEESTPDALATRLAAIKVLAELEACDRVRALSAALAQEYGARGMHAERDELHRWSREHRCGDTP